MKIIILKNIIALIIVIVFCIGCSRSDYKTNFDRIEKHIKNTDKVALVELDSLEKIKSSFSKSDKMNYELLLASAKNKFFISLKSDSSMGKVAGYYWKHGTKDEIIRSYYLLGCVYRDKGDATRAIESYNTAVEEADTNSSDCNYYLLCRIYAQMASLFHEQQTPQLELNMWRKAIYYAKIAKDTLASINYLSHSAGVYHMQGNKKGAVEITRQAYRQYIAYGRYDLAAATLTPIIDDEISTHKYHEAKRHIEEYIRRSDAFDKNGKIAVGRENFYAFIGKYYEGVDKNDSALHYYRKLLETPGDIANLQSCYGGLMSVFQKEHIPDSVAKYASLYAELSDSATVLNSATEIIRTNALYNYKISQQQAMAKEKENSRLQRILYLIVISFTVFPIVLYRYSRRLIMANKEKLMEENKRYSDLLYRYSEQTGEIYALKSNINDYQAEKESEVKQLQKELSLYRDDTSKEEKWDFEQTLLSNQAIRRMHDLARYAKIPTEQEWQALIELVSENLANFYQAVSDPRGNLREREIQTCVLIRLYFISSEIATLFSIKKQRVSNIRSSINKKLFHSDGTNGVDKNIRSLQ